MLNAIDYINLAEKNGLPLPSDENPAEFFDWSESQKDILMRAWLKSLDTFDRHDVCLDITDHVDLMFDKPDLFIQKCKNSIYSELEESLIALVDECLGLGEEWDEGSAFKRGE